MGKAGEAQVLGRVWRAPTPWEACWRTKSVTVILSDSTTQYRVHGKFSSAAFLGAQVGAVGEVTGDKDVTPPVLVVQAGHFPQQKL